MATKITKPLVSVIIPHYRRTSFTLQAIRSILKQKYFNQGEPQIIISVDDPMTTQDKKKITSLSDNILVTKNTYCEGPGGNRQNGLKYAKGKYITFLDSDDQLEPNFLDTMISTLNSSQSVAAVCLSQPFFEKNFPQKEKLKLFPLMYIRDISLMAGYFLNRKMVYPASFYLCQLSHVMFKSSVLKNFHFNYDYRRGGEDWDLIVKTLQKGSITIVPKRLLKFRYSPGSSTFTKENQKLKWGSYTLLANRLPWEFKQGFFYRLFLLYINLFKPS